MTSAKTGYGTLFQVETSTPGTFETIGEVTSISGPDVSLDMIDATHIESADQWEELIPGIRRTGEISIECAMLPDNNPQINVLAHLVAGATKNFKIDVAGTTKNWTFSGYVVGVGQAIPFDGKMTRTIRVRATGKPAFAAP